MVGDEEQRPSRGVAAEAGDERALRLRVEGGGCLVEQQDAAGAQQGTGDGDALRLPFTEAATLFGERRVEALRQGADEVEGHGGVQRLVQLLGRSVGVAHQQVVTHGAAEQRVALRHVDEVAARAGRDGAGRRAVGEGDAPLLRLGQGQEQAHEGGLATARLAHDGGARAGLEAVAEAAEHGRVALGVGEAQVLHGQYGRAVEADGVAPVFGGQAFQLEQAVGGGQGVDHGGHEAREVERGALDAAHELQEGGQRAHGDAARTQAQGAPDEGGDVASGKGGGDGHAGGQREARAAQYLRAQVVLQRAEAADAPLVLFQRLDDGAVLQGLLDDGLDTAVAATDVVSEVLHAAQVEAGAQQEQGQDAHHEPRQHGVEDVEEGEGSHELHDGDHGGGQRGGEQGDDGRGVLLHAVHHIARMQLLQRVPAAAQQSAEEAVAQGVGGLHPHAGGDPRIGGATKQLQGEQADGRGGHHGQASGAGTGGDIYQLLRRVDEAQGKGGAQDADEATQQDTSALSARQVPEIGQKEAVRFHGQRRFFSRFSWMASVPLMRVTG